MTGATDRKDSRFDQQLTDQYLMRRRKVPVFYQLAANECGAACVAMILGYFGKLVSRRECRDKCGVGRDGTTALDIIRVAAEYGLESSAYSGDLDLLDTLPCPAIVHWSFNHFMVLESWSASKGATVVDPGYGRRRIPVQDFANHFTGVALTFRPSSDFQRSTDAESYRPWRYYPLSPVDRKRYLSVVIQLLVATLAGQCMTLLFPMVTKIVVDTIAPARLKGQGIVLACALGVLCSSTALISYLRGVLILYLRQELDWLTLHKLFTHMLSLPYSYFSARSTGDLLIRFESNAFLRELVTSHLVTVALDLSFVSVYFAILLSVSRSYAAIVAGLAAVQILLAFAKLSTIRDLMDRELIGASEERSAAVEAIEGIRTVKALGAELRVRDWWAGRFASYLNVSSARRQASLLRDSVADSLTRSSTTILVLAGLPAVTDGSMSAGSLLALVSVASYVLVPLGTLTISIQQLLLAGIHLSRIADVMSESPERARRGTTTPVLSGRIEVRDLSYRYTRSGPDVLKNISFSVEPGQFVAFVGPTGSGKSTLASLIVGLLEEYRGQILFDGIPLAEIDPVSLRQQCAVVLQDSFLFAGSIKQNLSITDPTASLGQLYNALDLAALNQTVERMPMGLETQLNQGGASLSGGERQRLTLARAFVQKPRILVLDEASSHLDVATEAVIQRNLETLHASRIVIAHRLSTVRNADAIFVIQDGRIVESGTPDELLRRRGLFFTMWQRSSGGQTPIPRLTAEAC